MRRGRRIFDLLAQAVGGSEPVSIPPDDIDDLVTLAQRHRVAGQLPAAFASAGLPVPAAVEHVRRRALLGHLQKVHALQRATAALDRAGVASLVVKGPVLASEWYGDPAARMYHDLDVLVDRTGFAAAIDALVAVGFAERNRNWTGYRALGMGEVPLDDGTVAVDLHWHLVTFAGRPPVVRLRHHVAPRGPAADPAGRADGVPALRRGHLRPHRAPRRPGRRPAADPPA